jgi:uncharacterized protein
MALVKYSWPVIYYMYDYLFQQIIESKWSPDVILMILRGGAYVGGALYERFRERRDNIAYGAIAISSYSQERHQNKLECFGCTFQAGQVGPGSKVLMVDDIFDTGATAEFVSDYIAVAHSAKVDVRLAVLDYKIKAYLPLTPKVVPYYYARKFEILSIPEDVWIEYPFFSSI